MNDERVPIGLGDGFDPDACGQDERKYSAANPVVRWLIERLCKRVAEVIGHASGVILDVGTGEGLAIERVTGSLDEHRPDGTSRSVIGVEYRAAKVRAARQRNPQMAAVVADIGMLPFRDGSIGTVLCMEVLEHLDRPEPALRELRRVANGQVVLTVPFEPIFRIGNLMRGKNIRLFGNDPEHVQQFNPHRLRRLAATSARKDRMHTRLALPWLIGTIPGASAGRPEETMHRSTP